MKSLRKIIQQNLLWLAAILMATSLFVGMLVLVISVQVQTRDNAETTFTQIQHIIKNSNAELEVVEAQYRETCLHNAEAIAYVVETNPAILGNVEEFRQLAVKLEVNEIHIFDNTGRIFTGTHPEYFDYTFDSGEQIGFFKPMLYDKSLRLCQDITPNTAEGKLVQYSALWSSNQQYIVQVGMYPESVLSVTEKSELSYIFSLLRGTPGVSLYAVSPQTGAVIGSTTGLRGDISVDTLGISFDNIGRFKSGAHVKFNGVNSYCIFKEVEGTVIGYVIANDQMYADITSYSLILSVCLLVIAAALVWVVKRYTDRYIIGSIATTNECLRAVTSGDWDRRVDVQSCEEFSELSSHINSLIQSLLANINKMSLVLNRTNLRIGVYEYNTTMSHVRFTEHVPEILGLSADETLQLAADYHHVQEFIDCLRAEPVPDMESTYHYIGKQEMYIKLEEIVNDNAVLGIIMDVTEEVLARKRAENERDHDLMTGLYNRRGMESQFERLFANPSAMGCGALVMIDSDNLKNINDTYGHAMGDVFLKRMAEVLDTVDAPSRLLARTGGDEFVLLIYGYSSDEAVQDALLHIQEVQDTATVRLDNGVEIPLTFSYGYELTRGRFDHELMLSVADSHMYNSKRMRKRAAGQLNADNA